MHTVRQYPSLEEDLNLKMIQKLESKYNLPEGYSGHEVSVSPSLIAVSLGAKVIERHITIDRAMYRSDQAASLQPSVFRQLCEIIRKIKPIIGDGKKKILDEEFDIAKKLRYWNQS